MAPFYSSTISCLFGGSNDPVKAVIDIETAVFLVLHLNSKRRQWKNAL